MVYEQQVCGLYDKNLVPVSFFFILQLELKTIDNERHYKYGGPIIRYLFAL